MTVASRIAVMNHGELVQIATPGDIYETPNSRYTAQFLGDVNVFEGKVAALSAGTVDIEWTGGGRFKAIAPEGLSAGQQVWLGLRPEKMRIGLTKPANGNNVVSGKVDDVGYLGSTSQYHTLLDGTGQRVTVLRTNAAQSAESNIKWEDRVWIEWPVEAGVVLTK